MIQLIFLGLSIADNFRYLKAISWMNLILGIFLMSVVLFFFAIPLGFLIDLFIGLLFFEASRELREWQAAQ